MLFFFRKSHGFLLYLLLLIFHLQNTSRSNAFDDSLIGANASAEEAAEGTDDQATSGIDIILDNRYNNTGFGSKKEYQAYFKGYAKA